MEEAQPPLVEPAAAEAAVVEPPPPPPAEEEGEAGAAPPATEQEVPQQAHTAPAVEQSAPAVSTPTVPSLASHEGAGSGSSLGDGKIVAPQPRPLSRGWTRGSGRRIIVGVCARDKKAKSKAMTEILSRFDKNVFELLIFGDNCILNRPVEEWPYCDALIAFYSTGFPLDKADEYVELHQPYILNDLKMQRTLHDRRLVYKILMENNVDVPVHAFLNRDGGDAEEQVIEEYDEYVVVNGVQITKPLVEKPANAEDHNVYIYYPLSMGGGSKRLFRKIGDRSSEFYPEINEVRRDGSYIYEEFVETQGTDVKVYTVGPDYGHAEARKSPVVDGKVNRNEDGKEVRFPVILSPAEKEIARKVCLAFKQTVCGFDLLRVQGRSYVCDVNGWSFVKNSRKYYDDCAQLLSEFITAAMEPGKISGLSAIGPLLKRSQGRLGKTRQRPPSALLPPGDPIPRGVTPPITSPRAQGRNSRQGSPDLNRHPLDHKEELRCVIAIIRHGDRTPKQKMKMLTSYHGYLEFYRKYSPNDCHKDVKIKSKYQLLEFLALTKTFINQQGGISSPGGPTPPASTPAEPDLELLYKLHQIRDVLERSKIAGFNRKLQLKPRSHETITLESEDQDGSKKQKEVEVCTELMLILKWGGDLTKLGEKQAARLGERFTQAMYPDPSGGGILRLHSTFRHDLKIKASDEGRVMKTAAAFTKGMLELEGELTPILVSLVHREKQTIHMLDPSGNNEIKQELEECKRHLHQMMQQDVDLSEEDINQIVPMGQTSIKHALRYVKNPRKALFRMRDLIYQLAAQLEMMAREQGLPLEPISRTGSYTTLGGFMSANNLLPAEPQSARGHVPNHFNFNSEDSQPASGSQASSRPAAASVSDMGCTSWADLRLQDVPSSTADLTTLLQSNPLPSPQPGTSIDALFTPSSHPIMLEGGTPSSSLQQTLQQAGSISGGGGHRVRRGSSMTDFDPNECPRWEESIDNRSEGYPDSESAFWAGTAPSSRSNSVVALPVEMPRSFEPQGNETLILMLDRWRKLHKDLYNAKTDSFDLSKVPDVHDNIRYDMLHNWHLGLRGMDELHDLAKHFADCIVPQEYGVDSEEKRVLGSHMCQALLEKIKYDLIIARTNESFDVRYNLDMAHAEDLPINSLGRRVRTRLYFTSESHLHSLLNVLRFPEEGKKSCFSPEGRRMVDNTPELCYLTHIVLRMFEDLDKHEDDPTRFRIEIAFSPGVTAPPSPVFGSPQDHMSMRHVECEKWRTMNTGLTWDDLNSCIDDAMRIGRKKPELPRHSGKSRGKSKDKDKDKEKDGPPSASQTPQQPPQGTPTLVAPSPSVAALELLDKSLSGSVVPAEAPTTPKASEAEYGLLLEQGPIAGGQKTPPPFVQEATTPQDGAAAAGGTEETSAEVRKRLGSDDETHLIDDLQRSRSPSFNISQGSTLLSAAVIATASVIGGVMLLSKQR